MASIRTLLSSWISVAVVLTGLQAIATPITTEKLSDSKSLFLNASAPAVPYVLKTERPVPSQGLQVIHGFYTIFTTLGFSWLVSHKEFVTVLLESPCDYCFCPNGSEILRI